jgi:adenine C2-methylase RlmN of 23S rRNA A2503 and tRNA A37
VKVKLAVSLHSAIDEIRSKIMPFSKISFGLIYENHWNIGTENKKNFLNVCLERYQ